MRRYKPENFQDGIANLTFKDSKEAMRFYEAALGATAIEFMEDDKGWVMHGEMRLGDTVFFFTDEAEFISRKAPKGPASVGFYLYVEDVDAAFDNAVKAGMKSHYDPQTMFWGDRTAVLSDPFHYMWTLATKVASPSLEEMAKGREAMFGGK